MSLNSTIKSTSIYHVLDVIDPVHEKENTFSLRDPALIQAGFCHSDHPLKNMVDRGIFDSGCSGHSDSFDMKTPTTAKGFACLIAKATSDESNMSHRRFSLGILFGPSKDETSGILQNFIRQIENQLNHRVKIIRSDNGTEFKNRDMLEFCGNKGIKQEYSNARTPQQNGVAKRMNRTLIEAARTMLADSLLPTTFWAEAVSTACYVLNRLSVLGKFDGKFDDGFLVEPQQEKEDSSTSTSEDNPKILAFRRELEEIAQKHLGTVPDNNSTSTPSINSGSEPVNTGELNPDDSAMPELEIFHKSEIGIFDISFLVQILGDPKSAVQTRSKVQQKSGAHALISYLQKQQRNNHKDQQHCLFACFLSQEEPKKISDALQDDSWVQAMQEELLQFKLQTCMVLVDLPQKKTILAGIAGFHMMYGRLPLVLVAGKIVFGCLNTVKCFVQGLCGYCFNRDGFAEIVDFLRGLSDAHGQEAPSVTQPQPSSTVVPPTPPTTQPIPSEAITITPLYQPTPPTPIAETTTASPLPSPSPSPAYELMEHTFE
ncbi:putative ribonuclease H-like domain-containing protein [Tanacetum coccineum]